MSLQTAVAGRCEGAFAEGQSGDQLRPAAPYDVSVIVPTYNRPGQVQECLEALAAQSLSRNRFEVIVIDDGGVTPLEPVIAPFVDRLNVRLVVQANAGPARARNVGAGIARGSLLVFTDDDCLPEADWLGALLDAFRRWPDRAIGGSTVNALSDNICSTASQLLIDYLNEHHASGANGGSAAPFFTSCNLAVSAVLFQELGGFDESFRLAAGEDREFCDRWQAQGYRLQRAPRAVVRHAHALSITTFLRQHTNYGCGAFQFQCARARHGRPGLRAESPSFYVRLLMYPIRASHRRSAPRLIALLLISQFANAFGFVSERRRSSRQPDLRRHAAPRENGPVRTTVENSRTVRRLAGTGTPWLRALYLRDLLRELLVREMKLRYERSLLGVLWAIINPLAQLVVFVFVFQHLLRLRTPNYGLFVFCGILAWNWTREALLQSTGAITGNRELIRQPRFPIGLLPVVALTTPLIDLLISLPLLMLLAIFTGDGLTSAILFLPVVIAAQFLLLQGLGYLLAAAQVTFRDTGHLLGVILMLGFYLTPVFYSVEDAPSGLRAVMAFNPMAQIITAYRVVIVRGLSPDLRILFALAGAGVLLSWAGWRVFTRASHHFAEEL